MDYCLLSSLPSDLFASILIEWIGAIKDVNSLDNALTNKILREKYLSCCRMEIKSVGLSSPISISTHKTISNNFRKIANWKEKRELRISKLIVQIYVSGWNGIFSKHFSDLRELDLTYDYYSKSNGSNLMVLFSFFFRLEVLKLKNFTFLCDKEVMSGLSVAVKPTNIKELYFNSCSVICGLSSIPKQSRSAATVQDLSEFFEWVVGKHCPKVETLVFKWMKVYCSCTFLLNMLNHLPVLSTLDYTVLRVKNPVLADSSSFSSQQQEHIFPSVKQLNSSKTCQIYDDHPSSNECILDIIHSFPSLTLLEVYLEDPKNENTMQNLLQWLTCHGSQLTTLLFTVFFLHMPDESDSLLKLRTLLAQAISNHCVSLESLEMMLFDGSMKIITKEDNKVFKKLNTLHLHSTKDPDPTNERNYGQHREISILCCADSFVQRIENLTLTGFQDMFCQDVDLILSRFSSLKTLSWEIFRENFSRRCFYGSESRTIIQGNLIRFVTNLMTFKNLKQLTVLDIHINHPQDWIITDRDDVVGDYNDATFSFVDKILEDWHFHFPELTSLTFVLPLVLPSWIHGVLYHRLLTNCPKLEFLKMEFHPAQPNFMKALQGKHLIRKLLGGGAVSQQ